MTINQTTPEFSPLNNHNKKRLDNLYSNFSHKAKYVLGYPCMQGFDYSLLYRFLDHPINNIGDPFQDSNFQLHTHEFECDVIRFFCHLMGASIEDTWGYVTNGGTEGNLYGTYLAREIYPDGTVYYSEDTHYSVAKILRMVHARNLMIKSQPNGEIDYLDLEESIKIHPNSPPIIFANLGTTMKGAVDNVHHIREIMQRNHIEKYYIHADAALSGMILPFVDKPQPFRFTDGIDSLSISGHKMIGSPIPCGIVLAKKTFVNKIAHSIEYISSYDTTVSGSRNGISPLFLWYAIQTRGIKGFKEITQRCLAMADYTVAKFQAAGLNAWRNPNSITIVFPRRNEAALKKWQIAVNGDDAHLVIMPHIEKKQIIAVLQDIIQEKLPCDS